MDIGVVYVRRDRSGPQATETELDYSSAFEAQPRCKIPSMDKVNVTSHLEVKLEQRC